MKKSFFSKQIEEIRSEADSTISTHLSTLDHISNDIKAIENVLQSAALPFTFIYVISSEEKKYKESACNYVATYGAIPDRTHFIGHEDHCLVWGYDEEKGFRLSYNIYLSEDSIEYFLYEDGKIERPNQGKPFPKFSKPLIETKSHFRLKVQNELSIFYKRIIDHLKLNSGKEVIIEESPNYDGFISQISNRGIVE